MRLLIHIYFFFESIFYFSVNLNLVLKSNEGRCGENASGPTFLIEWGRGEEREEAFLFAPTCKMDFSIFYVGVE